MQYLLLIYGDEKAAEAYMASDPEAAQAEMAQYFTFTDEVGAAGVLRGGEGLYPTSAATTIRVRDGKTLTTHGPFAETKEQLLGFYVVEADSLDEVIAFATELHGSELRGSFEIRPLRVFRPGTPLSL